MRASGPLHCILVRSLESSKRNGHVFMVAGADADIELMLSVYIELHRTDRDVIELSYSVPVGIRVAVGIKYPREVAETLLPTDRVAVVVKNMNSE